MPFFNMFNLFKVFNFILWGPMNRLNRLNKLNMFNLGERLANNKYIIQVSGVKEALHRNGLPRLRLRLWPKKCHPVELPKLQTT